MERTIRVVVYAVDEASIEDATDAAAQTVREQNRPVVDTSTRMFAFGEAEGRIAVSARDVDIDVIESHELVRTARVEPIEADSQPES